MAARGMTMQVSTEGCPHRILGSWSRPSLQGQCLGIWYQPSPEMIIPVVEMGENNLAGVWPMNPIGIFQLSLGRQVFGGLSPVDV